MLTIQDWLDAGYKRYDNHAYNNADFLLQKRFEEISEGDKRIILDQIIEDYTEEGETA